MHATDTEQSNEVYLQQNPPKSKRFIQLLQAEEERIYKEKQLVQEERMAQELARISYEKLRDEKMRQYVKENRYVHSWNWSSVSIIKNQSVCQDGGLNSLFNLLIFSVELRELEVKLKSAYMNRERAAQIAEKEAMRYETVVS